MQCVLDFGEKNAYTEGAITNAFEKEGMDMLKRSCILVLSFLLLLAGCGKANTPADRLYKLT